MFFVSGFVSAMLINRVEVTQEMETFLIGADLAIRVYVSLLFTVLWGMGPVTCGFTYVLRNYAREEHAWIFSDFWQHTLSNLKQSIVVFLIDVVAFISIIFAYNFYGLQTNALYYVRYIIFGLAFIYTLAHFYIYPLMITFKLSVKNIFRNSFLLAIAKLPLNVLTLIIVAAIHIVIPYIGIVCGGAPVIFLIVFVALEIFILVSLTGFVINFNIYPVIKENMLAKADPEKYGENTLENAESTLFSDDRTIE